MEKFFISVAIDVFQFIKPRLSENKKLNLKIITTKKKEGKLYLIKKMGFAVLIVMNL